MSHEDLFGGKEEQFAEPELQEVIRRLQEQRCSISAIRKGELREPADGLFWARVEGPEGYDDTIPLSAELIAASNDPLAEIGRLLTLIDFHDNQQERSGQELVFVVGRDFTEEEKVRIEKRAAEIL